MTRPLFETLSELNLGGCRRFFGQLQGIGNLGTEELLQPVKISAGGASVLPWASFFRFPEDRGWRD
jgi:hypothetical protein